MAFHIAFCPDDAVLNFDGQPAEVSARFLLVNQPQALQDAQPAAIAAVQRASLPPDAQAVAEDDDIDGSQPQALAERGVELPPVSPVPRPVTEGSGPTPPQPGILDASLLVNQQTVDTFYSIFGPQHPGLVDRVFGLFIKFHLADGAGPSSAQLTRLSAMSKAFSAGVLRELFSKPNNLALLSAGNKAKAEELLQIDRANNRMAIAIATVLALVRGDLGIDGEVALAEDILETLLLQLSKDHSENVLARLGLHTLNLHESVLQGALQPSNATTLTAAHQGVLSTARQTAQAISGKGQSNPLLRGAGDNKSSNSSQSHGGGGGGGLTFPRP